MRALLAAVIVMGVMILLGTAVLISTVVHRALHPALPASAASASVSASVLTLDQPPGTRIVAVGRQSDALLAVTLAGGGLPDRILVWDPAANRVVASLRLAR